MKRLTERDSETGKVHYAPELHGVGHAAASKAVLKKLADYEDAIANFSLWFFLDEMVKFDHEE